MTQTQTQYRAIEPDTSIPVYLRNLAFAYACLLPLEILPLAGGRSIGFPAAVFLSGAFLNYLFKVSATRNLTAWSWRAILLYVAIACASILWSVDQQLSVMSVLALLLQVLVMIALTHVIPGHWPLLVRGYGHGAALLALFAILAPADIVRSGRASVADVDENMTSFVLVLGAAALLGLARLERQERAWITLVELGLVVAAVLHVGSRTGAVALAGVMLTGLVLGLMASRSRVRVWVLLVSCGGVVALWAAARLTLIPDRVLSLVGPEGFADDSGRSRIIATYRYFQSDWALSGVGYGTDAIYLQAETGLYQSAHSLFWGNWVELGILGVGALSLLMVVSALNAQRLPTRYIALIAFVPIIAFGATLGGDRSSQFWFFIALCVVKREAFGPGPNSGRTHG